MTGRDARMKSLWLLIARFAVCAWIGAAALFVVTSVREVRSPAIDSMMRDVLVATRFPAFYAFGFSLIALGVISSWLARNHPQVDTNRAKGATRLLILALILMTIDYAKIYTPLVAMVTPPGKPRTPDFERYHAWSEQINGIGLILCLFAALRLHWPRKIAADSESSATRGRS
jgi:hypothetical protein